MRSGKPLCRVRAIRTVLAHISAGQARGHGSRRAGEVRVGTGNARGSGFYVALPMISEQMPLRVGN